MLKYEIKIGSNVVHVTKLAFSDLKKFKNFNLPKIEILNKSNKIIICLECDYLNNEILFSSYERIFILYLKSDYFGIYSIGKQLSGGCNECISHHINLLDFYNIEYDAQYTNLDICKIINDFIKIHNDNFFSYHYISKLGTSIFFPVVSCSKCELDRKDSANIFQTTNHKHSNVVKNSSGLRTLLPNDFCNQTSKFVGHSSCVKPLFSIDFSNEVNVFHYEAPLAIINSDTNFVEFAGGKGLSVEQSMASCIGEGLERYFSSGKFLNQKDVLFSSYNELCKNKVLAINPIDFFGLPFNFSAYSLERPNHYIDYSNDLKIEWLKGKNLSQNTDILIPANMVLCPYVHTPTYSATSTNGMSAGSNLKECIIQGCLELIERDAFWFTSRTGLGVRNFQHIQSQFPLHKFPNLNFYFMLLFSEFGLPVAQVVIENKNKKELPITSRGTGCAFDVGIAFNRAFSEALQMYYSQKDTVETDKRDEVSDMDMRWLWSSGQSRSVFPQFFDIPNSNINFDTTNHSFDNIDEALLFLTNRLRDYDTDLLYFDFCKEFKDFSVIRVMLTNISCFDQLYFKNNDRLEYLSKKYFHTKLNIKYTKSLFM